MNERQLSKIREALVDRLTALYRSVHQDIRESAIRDVFLEEEPPRDEGDESLRDQLRDFSLLLVESDARLAQQIEAALARIRDGTYGRCIECGRDIGFERLRVVPWAARCIEDQEAIESEKRQRPPTL